jgi:predicted Na+-dependent transporter
VAGQNSGGVAARERDRLIKWFIGVVVIGVGVNLRSSFVAAQKWAWLPPAVFVAALLVVVPSAGLLRGERYRRARACDMALLALTGYLAVTVWDR